jgi:hypothetical protein
MRRDFSQPSSKHFCAPRAPRFKPRALGAHFFIFNS